jgi:hypothetical protein
VKIVTQTLDQILKSLQPLVVEWQDDVAHRVVERMKALPVKSTYDVSDVAAILEGGIPLNKLTSSGFDDGLLILRLFLGLSKDQFTGVMMTALDEGGMGLKRYKADTAVYLDALVSQGILDAMMLEVNKPLHWSDTVIERLRSGRGSAISGQKRGRTAEDFAEAVIKEVFGTGNYQARATFTGKGGERAKCDFAIPDASNPRIVMESKGFAATGSKMSDVLGDISAIVRAKRSDTTFLLFTDGLTWSQRQSDLRKIIKYQNDGDIARIYTQSMVDELRADLIALKAECGL